jgi:hypothetical protein
MRRTKARVSNVEGKAQVRIFEKTVRSEEKTGRRGGCNPRGNEAARGFDGQQAVLIRDSFFADTIRSIDTSAKLGWIV